MIQARERDGPLYEKKVKKTQLYNYIIAEEMMRK